MMSKEKTFAYSQIKKVVLGLCLVTSLVSCSQSTTTQIDVPKEWIAQYVEVEYRASPVDVGAPYFENLGRSDSSVVFDAWFDSGNKYLVINLRGTNYQYCGVDDAVWQSLKTASSMGTFYYSYIKGSADCRMNPNPVYP